MWLRQRILVPAIAMSLSLGFVACSSDEQQTEEPVAPAATDSIPATDAAAVANAAAGARTAQDMQQFAAETIYFAFDDYSLTSEGQQRLNVLADFLKANANIVVQVEGHCDERGSIEYNLALGERRAQSVKNYLIQAGVDATRLNTISYGEENPAVQGHSEQAWSKNRRAAFTISAQ